MAKFAKKENTLVIIKPDAIERGKPTEIKFMILRGGLNIEAAYQGIQRREDMEYVYGPQHSGKPYYGEYLRFMTYSESELVLVSGVNAVRMMLDLKFAIRDRIGVEDILPFKCGQNLVHCSDPEMAEREVRYFTEVVPLLRRPGQDLGFRAGRMPSGRIPGLRR